MKNQHSNIDLAESKAHSLNPIDILPLLPSGDENGTVSLVDTKSAGCALSSVVHSQCVTGLVFSPHRYCSLSSRAWEIGKGRVRENTCVGIALADWVVP